MSPGSQLAVNTLDYTTVELLFFAAGGLAWALAYVGVLREIVRSRYVEIPAAACCAPAPGCGWSTAGSRARPCARCSTRLATQRSAPRPTSAATNASVAGAQFLRLPLVATSCRWLNCP